MLKSNKPSSCKYEISEKGKGEYIISFSGRMDVETSASILKNIHSDIKKITPSSITIDLDRVSYFDDFGAFVLIDLRNMMNARNCRLTVVNSDTKVKKILALVNFYTPGKCVQFEKRTDNIFVRLGESALIQVFNIRFFISFLGSIIISFFRICLHPKSLRINDTISFMEKTGVNALPIVALISFLLGLVIAFMSSLQLRQFGANIYVASLVSIAMVSELGPIMTAIVVAGRSGSAFAAEIGTMKISDEVDALITMGFDPTSFLAVPRIIAAIVVVPLLTLFSDLFAIAGGLVVGVSMLNLTMTSYITQTIETLTLFEVIWGMTKSLVFALLISGIGCLRGFQTSGGPDAVGNAATSAVVSSIFSIILFDSFFAVVRGYW